MVSLERGIVVVVSNAGRGLESIDISSPPWSTTPPERTEPHIAIRLHVIQHALDGRKALRVRSSGKLANDALLAVGLQPRRRGRDSLNANRARDADVAGP